MSLLFLQRKYFFFMGVPWFTVASKILASFLSNTLPKENEEHFSNQTTLINKAMLAA